MPATMDIRKASTTMWLTVPSKREAMKAAMEAEFRPEMALIGGQISSTIDVASSLVENHRAGKIRMLAVSSEQRIPQSPEVPTFAELGLPGISGMGFNALYAPAGTPAEAVAHWNRALGKVLALPDVKDKLLAMGYFPVGKSAQELIDRQNTSAKRWEPVIKASGFTAD